MILTRLTVESLSSGRSANNKKQRSQSERSHSNGAQSSLSTKRILSRRVPLKKHYVGRATPVRFYLKRGADQVARRSGLNVKRYATVQFIWYDLNGCV